MKYGTKEWLEAQYSHSRSDPWGLDWRPSQKYRYLVMLEALDQAISGSWQPLRVLDVGCATGLFTALLVHVGKPEAAVVTGIDIAESAIARARLRYPDIEFLAMSLDEYAAKQRAPIDVIVCLEMLYYLEPEQRRGALNKIRYLLRPGGLVLISSMIAQQPYMSPQELRDLVAGELEVIGSGVLYLKPVVLVEKLLMRIQALLPKYAGYSRIKNTSPKRSRTSGTHLLARVAQILFGRRAQSHAYVLARLPGGI